ncbi:MAG TPA: hypothetical protein VKM54_03330 [Myxococcota bacterium]|nr:hypothetical protein [Myxococcota bacterium]
MLLNLVRLRYDDTPFFLELGAVVSQYGVTASINGTGNIDASSGTGSASASTGLGYSENPTVTLTPLAGEDFAERMLSPISLDAVLLFVQTGWNTQRAFVISSSERIERENDPDCSSGPRLFFAGCPQGNIAGVRRDVRDQIALSLLAIAAEEPRWRDPDALPQCLGKVIDLLSYDQRVVTIAPGVIYGLPNGLRYEHPVKIVRGDSAEGQRMPN